MILIIDEPGLKRSRELRESIMNDGIACILATESACGKFPDAAVAFAFVNSENQLSLISIRCKKQPLLAYNGSGSRIYNSDVRFYDPRSSADLKEYIYNEISDIYNKNPTDLSVGNARLERRHLRIGAVGIRITPTERLILSFLMLHRGKWVSEDALHRSAFRKSAKHGRVAVHICNINNKAKELMGRHLIETKKHQGYRLRRNI